METWLISYRTYLDAELDAELAWLRIQIRNPYGAMTEGDRSNQRSTAEFRDRMAAASQVKIERAGGDDNRHMIADFSQVRV